MCPVLSVAAVSLRPPRLKSGGFEPEPVGGEGGRVESTPDGATSVHCCAQMTKVGVITMVATRTMGVNKFKLIDRWRCDATWALEAICLHCHTLFEVIMIYLLDD